MTIYHLPFYQLTLFIIHFSVPSVFSVAKNLSIKNNKLCKTNPISEKPKMIITLANTTNYNEQRTMNDYAKQTQTKPILPAVTPAKADETLYGNNHLPVTNYQLTKTIDETKKSV